MRTLRLLTAVIVLLAGSAIQSHAQSDPKIAANQWIDGNADLLKRINHNIWSWAETGLEETKSSAELQQALKANGFTVESGVANMPTAFIATYGSGKPVIGILAEYEPLAVLSESKMPSM